MELNNKTDSNYLKDKAAYEKLDKLKDKLKDTAKEIKKFARMKEDAEVNKRRAIEDKDKTLEQNADAAIKMAESEIKKLKENAEKMKAIIIKNKEKVDSYIKELNEEPEFRAHMNSILEKRYNRQMKKVIKEKEQVNLIIDLCEKHPSLSNNLKGMIHATEEIEKLKEELKTLDPVKDKARIDEINNTDIPKFMSKKSINEKSFMDFCGKNNVALDKQFLEKLIEEHGFLHEKTPDGKIKDIKLSKTLKNISKGYDKRINTYINAIQKIPGAQINQQNGEKVEEINNNNGNYVQYNNNLPAQKFKWWEFRKRFNAWREQRNARKEEVVEQGNTRESSEKFRDAYKYKIVSDYIDKKEQEIFMESAKEARKAKVKDSDDIEPEM